MAFENIGDLHVDLKNIVAVQQDRENSKITNVYITGTHTPYKTNLLPVDIADRAGLKAVEDSTKEFPTTYVAENAAVSVEQLSENTKIELSNGTLLYVTPLAEQAANAIGGLVPVNEFKSSYANPLRVETIVKDSAGEIDVYFAGGTCVSADATAAANINAVRPLLDIGNDTWIDPSRAKAITDSLVGTTIHYGDKRQLITPLSADEAMTRINDELAKAQTGFRAKLEEQDTSFVGRRFQTRT